ncbi:MAG TPA: tetratricopeptide repeat protein, partial [Puia sp.]|nr:tetratricopeptide repeat protein [Puia sp.]
MDVYTTIRQHLDNKELAIFCGAGISVPSGIPPVGGLTGQDQDIIIDGIVTEILKDLSIDETDIKTFFNAGIPFESFMGSLIENGLQLEKIIDIFDGEPCYYHDTIAQLISDGQLLKVATTNFDLCLEKAFLAATGRKLPVFRQVKRFAGNLHRLPGRFVAKIHGCLSDRGNMAITLQEIGKKRHSVNEMLTHFFTRSGSHNTLLIIGYSCSDFFDVTEYVQELIKKSSASLCKVIYWDFSRDMTPRFNPGPVNPRARIMLKDHPDILWAQGDLSSVFQKLRPGHDVKKSYLHNWKKIISGYIDGLSDSEKQYLKISVFFQSDNFKKAYDLLTKIIVEGDAEIYNIATSYLDLGVILKKWGKLKEASSMFQKAENLYKDIGDDQGQARLYGIRADTFFQQGDLDSALRFYKQEEALCRKLKDQQGIAGSIGNQANILFNQRKYASALKLYKAQQRICERIGDIEGLAMIIKNQGKTAQYWGNMTKAMGLYQKAEKIFEDLGNKPALADAIMSQAFVFESLGQLAGSIERYKKAEMIYEELGDKEKLAQAIGKLASLMILLGQLDDARSMNKKAASIYRQLGDYPGLASSMTVKVRIMISSGELNTALKLCKTLREIYKALKSDTQLSYIYGLEADILHNMGDMSKALSAYKKQEKLYIRTKNRSALAYCYNSQGVILDNTGEVEKASLMFKLAEDIFISLGDTNGLARNYDNQASTLMAMGKLEDAFRMYENNKKIFVASNDMYGLLRTYKSMGLAYAEMERWEDAMRMLKKEEDLCKEVGDIKALAEN